MKYSASNPPLKCMQTTSRCYRSTYVQQPVGVLWHCTGCNNPYIRRYVQPSDNAPDREAMLKLLGVNAYRNDWNHISHGAGLNAWIGKLADGTVAAVQSMPWNYRPWGCGSGSRGSCNSGWIQFEMCEDALTDPAYFQAAYREACELTAYLCTMYGIDPMGTVSRGGIRIPTILCHWDSYLVQMGCGHVDIYNWFNRHARDMDDVRRDVRDLMNGASAPPVKEEEEEVTQEEFRTMFMQCGPEFSKLLSASQDKFNQLAAIAVQNMQQELLDNDAADWSEDARQWAAETGLFVGGAKLPSGDSNYAWESHITREQVAVVLQRMDRRLRQDLTGELQNMEDRIVKRLTEALGGAKG